MIQKLSDDKNKLILWGFSVVSGGFFLGSNAVVILVPLRMADQGLSYSTMGKVMASYAIAMFIIKILVGRHTDIIGAKKYICVGLIGLSISTFALSFATEIAQYVIVLLAIGLSKGIFTSANSPYTMALVGKGDYGKGYGKIHGVTAVLTSCGGILVGLLYDIEQGKYAMYIVSLLLTVFAACAIFVLPDIKEGGLGNRIFSKELFSDMDKYIYFFCLIMFLQTFITSPMWNLVIPLSFYHTFAVSAAFLGVAMSLDELISAPTYFFAGIASDKFNIRVLTSLSFLLISLTSIFLLLANTPKLFLFLFLLCSILITFTYVTIPKAEIFVIRNSARGFELALISVSAALGDSFGNLVMGNVLEYSSIKTGIVVFAFVYLALAILTFVCLGNKRFKI